VAVSSTPAAATVATPCVPRISTVAAAPTLGPSGSWLIVTIAMSTAIESKIETATPADRSISQLRAICASTATTTRAIMRPRPLRSRSTARPAKSPRRLARASAHRPAPAATIVATHASGTHQGRPSGPTSVKDVSAARVASVATMGSSAPSSAGTRGLPCGLERRSVAIRAARPSWPLITTATDPTLDARYRHRRPTVAPVARTQTCQASVRANSARSCSAAAPASSHHGAACSAVVKVSLLPARTAARTATAATVTPAVNSLRVVADGRRSAASVLTALRD
jgi:hypothetical protein